MRKLHLGHRTVTTLLVLIFLFVGVVGPSFATVASAPIFSNVEGFVGPTAIGTLTVIPLRTKLDRTWLT